MSGSIAANAVIGSIQNFSQSTAATYAYDVVGVYDQSGNQLFPGVRPITLNVNESAKLMQHPVESGFTIVDHRIINPVEISLVAILDPSNYYDNYFAVKTAFMGNNSLVVQTRVGTFANLFIEKMPHDETAAIFDSISMNIALKEVQIAQAQTSQLATKNPADGATVSKGSQSGTTQTAPTNPDGTDNTGSVAYGWFGGSN